MFLSGPAIFVASLSFHSALAIFPGKWATAKPPGFPPIESDSDRPVMSKSGQTLPPYNTTYYFDQLIDHNDPGKGTFKQRYWFNYEFYEAGGPIVLATPGEGNAESLWPFVTNSSIFGQIADQENGAVVLFEHRFFGQSNPYPDLKTESLRLLTLDQSIEDVVYFAKNVKLPMPGGDCVTPDVAPWILAGGSYSGALTAWTKIKYPDTFWAAYASSAVVESIVDFWQYFEPIREYMPKNCSADVQAVVEYVDTVFKGANQSAIDEVKQIFGLSDLEYLDDAALSLGIIVTSWQSLSPSSGGGDFYLFCDALEVKDGIVATETGWGLDHALQSWGTYMVDSFLGGYCGDVPIGTCLGTHDPNANFYTNTAVDNSLRSWIWMVCNEFGWYQTGAPEGLPSLVSRLVTTGYNERQCPLLFPEAFSAPPVPTADVNLQYGGFDIEAERLFFAVANRDPWREATMGARSSPHTLSSDTQPISISDGFHCSDLRTKNGEVDASVKAVQDSALSYMKKWMLEWRAKSTNAKGRRN